MLNKQFVAKSKASFNDRLQAWRSDITEEEWCLKAQTQTMSTHLRLLQYKWLRRQYITPLKLHHFNPNIPDICYTCKQEKGTLFQWECTKVKCFWGKILNIISQIIGKVSSLDPRLCILHICPLNFNITKHERLLLILCLLEAKRVIACSCKTEESPGVSQ